MKALLIFLPVMLSLCKPVPSCPPLIYHVSHNGTITVANNTANSYPMSLAMAYVNDIPALATIAPALAPGDQVVLGKLEPPAGTWIWKVVSSEEPEHCYESGSYPFRFKVVP